MNHCKIYSTYRYPDTRISYTHLLEFTIGGINIYRLLCTKRLESTMCIVCDRLFTTHDSTIDFCLFVCLFVVVVVVFCSFFFFFFFFFKEALFNSSG